ncbi:carbohydrate ABC transporter membrane protein 2 (CUT1 family) [Halanaerobium saccharolyticum]|jgi:glucose/mannose transport system permease protein|uniref:Carbohydrate ABC transporter membrane protein 2 (CUT1 family) n=2 Tax=Halanaerobium saccharolyticum TaxID=43595 RepID=A0A2T5RTB7_9FIRM|nr:carbohydrate ABC transporter permease [Halanaerobium saccharolyticum]PTW03580.1 carbohydrate ABC transporter membrane protein 2 (CUT1 family) [Halanaerobium saccharolyticum]
MDDKMTTREKVLRYAILIAFAVFFLIPMYVLLSTSLKSFSEVSINTMWQLPSSLSFEGFREAFVKLAPNVLNSFYLVIPATLLSAIMGSMNGYVLSHWKFKGSDTLFALILFGMFIPYQSVLFPLVQFMQTIGLYGSIPGLILVHVVYGLPITTLMFRNYYQDVPDALTEAAKVDGANIFSIYRHIFFPISIPSFVVVFIWQFTNIWNEFLFAVSLTDTQSQPITVALTNLAGSQVVEWNVQMSGAIITALPTLLVYIIFGRYFIKGMLAGSVKG